MVSIINGIVPQLCNKMNCTGCMACVQKCPNGAISIKLDGGFEYPLILSEKCVACGVCVQVCPVINIKGSKGNRHENETSCKAAWNKNASDRMESSSGGVFSVFAEHVFAENGIVFGAMWDEKMNLVHEGIDKIDDLDALRRSKYVQSRVGNTFKEVALFLETGRKVLYCGTPCQIAGLHSFLGKKVTDNLITVDVLCQGVPSPYMFRKYLDEIEHKLGWTIVDCNFRSKQYGWRCGLMLLLLLKNPKNGRTKKKKMFFAGNGFYNSFIKEYFMRPSCYDCQFKNQSQGYYSDITIADFWRIGDRYPLNVQNYEKGISAVVINTLKGKCFFDGCCDDVESIDRSWMEFTTNGGLRSSKKPHNNEEAWAFLQNHTWKETQSKYFPMPLKQKIKRIMFLVLGEKKIRDNGFLKRKLGKI